MTFRETMVIKIRDITGRNFLFTLKYKRECQVCFASTGIIFYNKKKKSKIEYCAFYIFQLLK